MATTIRVYLDGGATPAATAQMNADRTFSVPVPGVPDGVHSFEVTAQEDGKAESPRVIQPNITVAHGTTQHPLVGSATGTGAAAGDLAAPGAPPTHPLAGDLVGTGTASADLTAPKLHPLAGDASGSGAAAADLTAPGQQSPDITYAGSGALVQQTVASGNISVPVPAGIQEGDVLVVQTGSTEYGIVVTPAGWAGLSGSAVFAKRAGASESALSLTVDTFDGEGTIPQGFSFRMHAFRLPTTSGAYLDGTAASADGTNGTTVTGPARTTSTANAMGVFLVTTYNFGQATFSSPGGSVDTIGVQSNGAGYASMALAYDSTPSNSAGAQPAPTLTISPSGAQTTACHFFLKGS